MSVELDPGCRGTCSAGAFEGVIALPCANGRAVHHYGGPSPSRRLAVYQQRRGLCTDIMIEITNACAHHNVARTEFGRFREQQVRSGRVLVTHPRTAARFVYSWVVTSASTWRVHGRGVPWQAFSGSPVRFVCKLPQTRRLYDLRNVNLPEADAVRQHACVAMHTTHTTSLLECKPARGGRCPDSP